jgi:hypothetical protein
VSDEPTCRVCGGNDRDAPCAYPGERRPGCLRDVRMAKERKARLKPLTPDQYEENLLQHGIAR